MKTKKLFIVLYAGILCSCTAPQYLPHHRDLPVNQYGAYIEIKRKNLPAVKGELIALEKDYFVVLNSEKGECEIIELQDINRFKLAYAKPTIYGWSIPILAILPFVHGRYAIFTIPAHLLVTILVTSDGANAFTFTNRKIDYIILKKFARFPAGIPEEIDISDISLPHKPN